MKKIFSILILSFMSVTFIQAQTEGEELEQAYKIVEKMPEFPGGDEGLLNFIVENVKYPASAIDLGIEGIVYVGFVVNKTGDVEDIKILRGVSSALDAEAVRVISLCNGWTPGEQQGKAVKVQFTYPIRFVMTKQR